MKSIEIKKCSTLVNIIYQILYDLLILILPLVVSPYISRVIGAEGVGIYSFHFSVAYYFVLFALLGIKNYGVRLIAKNSNDLQKLSSSFSSLLLVHIIISVFVVVIYILYCIYISSETIYSLIMVIFVVSAVFDVSWFYFGIERFKITVLVNSIVKIVNVICIFSFVKVTDDLWIYCMIMAAGFLVNHLLLWLPLHKYVYFSKINISEIKQHIKPLFILFIPIIAVSLYKYMDKIMIGMMSENVELGYYENAEKIVTLPLIFVTSFGTVMMAKISNLLISNTSNIKLLNYVDISMDLVLFLACGLSFGLFGIASVFAPVFWGWNFTPSIILIQGLSLTIPFVAFANVIRTQYLIPKEMDKEFLISIIAGALINLIVNSLLISRLGSKGAMIGTIFAELTVFVFHIFFVKNVLPIYLYIKKYLFYMTRAIIMCLIIYILGVIMGYSIFTLILQVISGCLLYFLIILFTFKKDNENCIYKYIIDIIGKRIKL